MMLWISLSLFLPVRNLSPLPLVSSTSAVTLSDMPRADPLPVAIALTIETAPCIVALTLVAIMWVLQIFLEGSFSSHLEAQTDPSIFQRLLLPAPRASHSHKLHVLLQI